MTRVLVVEDEESYSDALAYMLRKEGYEVAIAADGNVLAVRAVAHEETPGLGDRIDAAKSDWIDRFRGRSIADPVPERWTVRRDGGEFDELTGATITSRAVVSAVRDAVLYFQQHRDEIFELPAQ